MMIIKGPTFAFSACLLAMKKEFFFFLLSTSGCGLGVCPGGGGSGSGISQVVVDGSYFGRVKRMDKLHFSKCGNIMIRSEALWDP